jgi:hypothetical protein
MPLDNNKAWASGGMDDASREAFYKAALDRRERAAKDAKAVRNLGLIVGAGGVLAGLLAIGAACAVYLKTPVPPPPGYILIDSSTGAIEQPLPAKDAPKAFPETVRERAMRNFVVSCQSYIPQTWQKIDWHVCMLMASPDEQKRLASDMGLSGPHYPPTEFGATGWAMPTAFPAFQQRGATGTAPNQTFAYEVRYERTEIANGKELRARYTAQITFSFHPELKMTPADRLLNPSGLQVISFSTVKD